MKRQTTPLSSVRDEPEQSFPFALSVEGALQREIARLGEWLEARGLDVRADLEHSHKGSRDNLYWCYGYFMGLKQALSLLTGRDATVH